MNSRAPWILLLLLGALAVAIAVTGARVARQTEVVRVERGREPLRHFEDTLQPELVRLEALYEQHVRQIARGPISKDERAVRTACGWLVGLKQYSVIHYGTTDPDFHIAVEARINERIPEPVFSDVRDTGLPRPRVRLATSTVMEGAEDSGWVAPPGGPLLFWQRRDATRAVVLLLDPAAIRAAINGWLAPWARGAFAPVATAGGPDALWSPDDRPLLTTGKPVGPPNLLLPLRTRLGTWSLASWDRTEVRTEYHLPTLFGSAAAAVLVAVLGILAFRQQRSALRLAAQRVSFVNSVSHELRTPLTNMLLNLDLVSDHTAAAGAPRLALVREEAGRLGRLIENVLTFSRGEQGHLVARATACQPTLVLETVLEQFRAAFTRRAIVVHANLAPGTCVLDADALAQIAANLLSNVEKYAPGCEVTVATTLSNDTFRLRVADTGPGIPAHAAEKIFRPFERLDARLTEGVTGTGLGLAIARDLATSMSGTLHLLPSPRGATFELAVPTTAVSEPKINAA